MGVHVKCPACEHQTRYVSSEVVERGGQWIVKCSNCGNVVPIRKAKSLEELIREAYSKD